MNESQRQYYQDRYNQDNDLPVSKDVAARSMILGVLDLTESRILVYDREHDKLHIHALLATEDYVDLRRYVESRARMCSIVFGVIGVAAGAIVATLLALATR